eukprot:4491999-Pleurochrysis_carterae.AAC.1
MEFYRVSFACAARSFSLELLITWLTLVLKVMVQPSRLDALRSVVRMWFSGHWRTAAEVAPLCE